MSTAHTHHAIDYIEIPVTDIDAAKAFYAAAFGWSLVDYGPDYAGIQGDGKEMGGLRRDAEVRPGGPLVVLYSDDLEASAEGVTGAGGTIIEPIYPFPGGRRFHFADPAGNELAVWSPASG
jgi:predicted enzyme related to lactoylglutathione lyase